MSKLKYLFFLSVFCCFISSCLVVFKNPVLEKDRTVDFLISGIWYTGDDTEEVFMHVYYDRDKNLHIIPVKARPEDDVEESEMTGCTMEIKNVKYICLTEKKSAQEEEDKAYFIFRYEIKKDRLLLKEPDKKLFSEAIKTGKIKGVDNNNAGSSLLITDTPENVYQFIFDHSSDRLFPEEIASYTKVQLINLLKNTAGKS